MADEILINLNINGEDDLKKVDKGIENLGKTANKTQSEIQKIRKELRDAKSDMLAAEEGTEEYGRALARASAAQLRLKETNDKIRLGIRDFGETAKNVAGAVAGLSGGFTATIGVMNLFAGENENLQKAILGVQSALAVTQGLATFADSIENIRDLISGLSANNNTASDAIGELGKVSAESADDVSKLAKETAVLGSNLAGAQQVSDKASEAIDKVSKVSTENFNKLSQSGRLFNNITELQSKQLGFTAEAFKKFNTVAEANAYIQKDINVFSRNFLITQGALDKSTKQLTVSLNEAVEILEQQQIVLAANAQKQKEAAFITDLQAEANEKNAEKTAESAKQQDNLTTSTDKGSKAATGFIGSIGKSILTMVSFMAVIAGATLLISKLIEWINKVPEDIKIKISLEDETFANYQKVLEKVKKFEFDLNKAKTKEQKEQLDEIAKKEFKLTDERLNQIKRTANGWKLFFTEYLKLAKDTYYNEALIKQKVDASIQAQSSAAKRNVVLQGIKDMMEAAGFSQETIEKTTSDMRSGKRVTVGLQIDAQVREWRKLNDEVIKYNDNLKLLNKIPFKNIGNRLLSDLTYTAPTQKSVKDTKVEDRLEAIGVSKFTQADMEKYAKDLANRVREAVKKELSGVTGPIDLAAIFKPSEIGYETFLSPFDTTTIGENVFNYIAKERNNFEKRMEVYQSYADSLAMITDSIVGLYDARLTAVDNYYNAEARLIENSLLTEEEKNKKLSELDEKRYKEQSALFEQQKKWQEAFVYLNLASGLMNIYTRATLPVPLGGTPSPFNWIQAGLETAALIGQSVSQIANIRAQQLNAPSGVSGGSNVSVKTLSPNKTALTSSEENLNMMIKGNANNNVSVVKVSDINEVQNKVNVREANSNY